MVVTFGAGYLLPEMRVTSRRTLPRRVAPFSRQVMRAFRAQKPTARESGDADVAEVAAQQIDGEMKRNVGKQMAV